VHEANRTTRTGPVAFLDLLLGVKLPDGSRLGDADVQVKVFVLEGKAVE
jgi:hypothetical protein